MVIKTAPVRLRFGAQTVGRKTSWANYFLGDRRLGNKLGRYGDSKLDGWATCFRRLGEMCEKVSNAMLTDQAW